MTASVGLNPREVARLIDVDLRTLSFIGRSLSEHLTQRQEPKRSGGHRTITMPNRRLKAILRSINKHLLSNSLQDPLIYMRKGRSQIVMAQVSAPYKYVLAADIRDFYPSTRPSQVRRSLSKVGLDDEAAKLITRLTTYDHQLPQGFPTSPALATLCLAPVLKRLRSLATSRRLTIGIYADNLLVASNTDASPYVSLIANIFKQNGYSLHKVEVMTKDGRREALGLVLKVPIKVADEYIERVRSRIGLFKKVTNSRVRREEYQSIVRQIGYVRCVNKLQAAELELLLGAL